MYDTTDPRSTMATAPNATLGAAPDRFAEPQYGLFYKDPPAASGGDGRHWYIRGQNFIVAYSELAPGAVLTRTDQVDEFMLLLPDAQTRVVAEAGEQKVESEGYALLIIPPGNSRLTFPVGGKVVRLFSARSADLAAQCANAAAYAKCRPNIPSFEAWPEPVGGFRIRCYSLDVPDQPGRFGRIWRCTTMMVNFFAPYTGPRDVTKLSPHHHDDFEQCSLALDGTWTHHIRWPWTANFNAWLDDVHAEVRSPSATIIPPPAIHTSRGMSDGSNQLVDIFSPPRVDFSLKPGWILNGYEYPLPPGAA